MNPNFTWAKGYYDRDLTDEQRDELVEHRGGCTCFLHPPCNACCEPIPLSEAVDLGWLEDDELEAWTNAPSDEKDQANIKEFVYGKDSEWAEPIDYMKAVRDMCR